MRRLAAVLALVLAPLAFGQYVADVYKGRITSAGTSVNSSTVAGLNANGATGAGASGLAPGAYTIQCKDGAVYFELQTTTTGAVTSTTGVLVQAAQPWPFAVPATGEAMARVYFAVISSSGTVNCDVWKSNG